MLKKVCLFFIACCMCCLTYAQTTGNIPPFKVRLTSNQLFSYKDLKKNVPTVLIYFSPTCEHCNEFTKELVKHESALKNKQLVFITYLSLEETLAFDKLYKLSSNPNIKVGSEGYTFVVQKYYNIQKFPYIILFNEQQKMVKKLSPTDEPGSLAKQVSNFNPR
ncbi:thioredoxin-like domain-containing protein [Parafilimonas sp.]|uniref:thioredoxin-like domain-containing protein n=1 Tax=Parafilimonas sp. TaxID=1969739 RepID=UPI0039E26027